MKETGAFIKALGASVLLTSVIAVTPALAALIAYDQFDEYADGESLSSTNSGSGFSDAWSSCEADASGLSYLSLPVAGGSGTTGSSTNLYKGFSRTLVSALTSGTYYFGFLMNKGGSSPEQFRVYLKNSSNDKHISAGIWDSLGDWRLIRQDGSGQWDDYPTGVSVDSSTVYCVLKLDLGAGSEVARLFVNPTSAGDLTDGSENASYTFSSGMGALSILQLNRKHSGGVAVDQVWVDEIRIGTAAADMFGSIEPDVEAPIYVGLNPANDANDVAVTAALTISFDELVKAGTGSFLIKESAGGATFDTISAASATFNGTHVTITPASHFEFETGYYVEIADGVIEDLAGNAFAGITSSTEWTFTTEEVVVIGNDPALFVYEGFQYGDAGTNRAGSSDLLHTQPDGIGGDVNPKGLGGAWTDLDTPGSSSDLFMLSGSLTFGDLLTMGNSVRSDTNQNSDRFTNSVTANLAAGSELWFSILADKLRNASYMPYVPGGAAQGGFVIGNQAVSTSKVREDDGTTGLQGFGVAPTGSDGVWTAYAWNGSSQEVGDASLAVGTSGGDVHLLVGKIVFNAGAGGIDQYSLYDYQLNGGSVAGGTLSPICSTIEVDVDESTLDTLSLTRQVNVAYDELRIGLTLDSVLGVYSPAGTVLIIR